MNAYCRDDEQNLDLNPTYPSAPQRRNCQLGFSYKLGRQTNLSLDYWNRMHEDRFPDSDFDFNEETLRLTIGHNFKKFTLWGTVEGGEKHDESSHKTGQLQEYSVSASWSPTQNQSYRGYLQFEEDNFRGKDWRRVTGGVNASFRLGRGTSASVGFQRNQYEGLFEMGRDQVELEAGHKFRNEHELLIRGRYASYSDSFRQDETAVMFEYGIPFGLPVSRKTSTGILKGWVYDAETRQGIPRVLVRLNELTTVTDRNGNFTFGSLRPGTHYLALDKGSIGMERVTVQRSPIAVSIIGGKRNRVEVGVTRSASVGGRVVLYRFTTETAESADRGAAPLRRSAFSALSAVIIFPAPSRMFTWYSPFVTGTDAGQEELVESDGLANMLVELANPSESLRRLTDRKGRFTFEDVRPGQWTLKVQKAGLPEHHYLEPETFELDLKPGETKDLLIKALPRKRPIIIIDEGGVLQTK